MTGQPVFNTLRVPCFADELRVETDETALGERLARADDHGEPVAVIGGGTNLVPRARLPGLAVRPRIRGIAFERRGERRWRVTAGAGERWHELVRACLGRGIAGVENLALIPGSVGAAPVQNIGAYGRELAAVLESVTVIDRRRRALVRMTAAECAFAYRGSRFKADGAQRFVVVRVALALGDLPPNACYPDVRQELARLGGDVNPRSIAEAVIRVRRRKLPDPRRVGNVGSFFQNPFVTAAQLDALRERLDIDAYPDAAGGGRFKIPAARLIDRAGWKGARHGAAQVWPRQPLVLVNLGGATGADMLALAARIQADVVDKWGVCLQLEPAVMGVD